MQKAKVLDQVFKKIGKTPRLASTSSSSDKTLAAHFDAIFNAYDGIWICDGEGIVLRFNEISAVVNGIREEAIVGKHVSRLVEWGYVDRTVTEEVIEKRRPVTIVQRCIKTGKKLLVTGTPVFDDHGEMVLVVSNGRDITELDTLRHRLMESEAKSERFRRELLQHDLDEMGESKFICRSAEMKQILKAAMHVARFDTGILITGPSGAGKGLLAEIIHKLSSRKNGPLIRVDCGSIPASLFESEVFGYEKGAFTGAREGGKPGLFEVARGGTLLLDEISHISFEVQPKLLRFLEAGEMIRVGSTTPVRVDVRVIAATNVDLFAEVEAGRFRRDLFYRLNVVPLVLPALKDRTEDIPFLLRHFLQRFNDKFGTRKCFDPDAIEAMVSYQWPGNVRELENMVERMVVMTVGDMIQLGDLPEKIIQRIEFVTALEAGKTLSEAVDEFERKLIELALRKYETQERAAKALGVSQATIARKRQKKFPLKPKTEKRT